ncbi:thioredoxin domain-containing protein [Thiohalophilus sp.]|uniref:thioredoxin domain-containing protein n=1 Tax=Thiohalophilus sp. TaxID=3028392 RepID=UPI002ACE3DA4|nr:DUF255 domain-containing protein [Thiohalophilus sp.]MDZ7803607.1 DUF255 domain-containing protein [Thiohalophilus sp.]
MRNELADHGSAYLAMHGDDPVHWQLWNTDAVARAKQQNKLLYVSSGYFSCHWCHVMQRESYQNREIAALLNRHFIPVKVDRELNPALDDRLIDFVEQTQGYSGWPLNVFITPDGYPLVGMVYQPPEDFRRILERIHQQWQSRATQLNELARETTRSLDSRSAPAGESMTPQQLRQRFIEAAMNQADDLQGGFGDQNKFPSVPQLETLLSVYQQDPDKHQQIGEFLRLTLDMMAQRGLYDHLAGGFFRYVVDPDWQVPHFEKMLYDNAQLASLYLRAERILMEPRYRQVGLETLDFLHREFQLDNGGLLASFSALDGNDVEGGYYLWQEDEFKQVLNEQQYQVASRAWGVSGPPELDHGHHLQLNRDIINLADTLGMTLEETKQILQQARDKLLAYRRSQRILPKDNKQIAAWNGLALSAYVAGAREHARFDDGARELATFLVSELWDGKQLRRAANAGQQLGQVGLEDYAYVARGLLDYAAYVGDQQVLATARAIIKQAWLRFYSRVGWQLQELPLLRYGARQMALPDGPMPSPSAVLLEVTQRLLQHHSDEQLKEQWQQAKQRGMGVLQASPFWHATRIMQ